MFRREVIYVQVHRGHFLARRVRGPKTVRRECTALSHPRTLAGDFTQLQAGIRSILNELWLPQMWLLKPDVLVHLIPQFEGGYTNIELRAFKEAAEGAGARIGWLCDNAYGPLTDQQVYGVFDA